jgi:hypothetical protein
MKASSAIIMRHSNSLKPAPDRAWWKRIEKNSGFMPDFVYRTTLKKLFLSHTPNTRLKYAFDTRLNIKGSFCRTLSRQIH